MRRRRRQQEENENRFMNVDFQQLTITETMKVLLFYVFQREEEKVINGFSNAKTFAFSNFSSAGSVQKLF